MMHEIFILKMTDQCLKQVVYQPLPGWVICIDEWI